MKNSKSSPHQVPESVTVLDINGNVLDYIGEKPEEELLKAIVTIATLIISCTCCKNYRYMELRAEDRNLVIVLDPPLIRVASFRTSH